MKKIIIGSSLAIFFSLASYCEPIEPRAFNEVYKLCSDIVANMEFEKNLSSNILHQITLKTVVVERGEGLYGTVVTVNSPLYVRLDNNRIPILVTHRSVNTAAKDVVQKIPKLTVAEAISTAKDYLLKLGVELPANMTIKIASFNKGYQHCWEVRWEPSYGGYGYDDFVAPYEQSMVVVFHEKLGFCIYGCRNNFPAPRSTEVKISKEDAVIRAIKVAPFVMKTPYYQMARVQGFKISGLDKAELLVAAPNWLLDPDRAQWIREKVPEESRLCWVVSLLTVDAAKRKNGLNPIPPTIVVYVDAATGEIVGANFT